MIVALLISGILMMFTVVYVMALSSNPTYGMSNDGKKDKLIGHVNRWVVLIGLILTIIFAVLYIKSQ